MPPESNLLFIPYTASAHGSRTQTPQCYPHHTATATIKQDFETVALMRLSWKGKNYNVSSTTTINNTSSLQLHVTWQTIGSKELIINQVELASHHQVQSKHALTEEGKAQVAEQ